MADTKQKDMGNRSEPSYFSRQIHAAKRFYYPSYLLADIDSEPFFVFAGGWEHCSTGYEIDRTSFPYYALEFVVAGHGTLTLGGANHELIPGAFFSYGPDIPHAIHNDPNKPLEKYFVNIRCGNPDAFLKEEKEIFGKSLYSVRPHSIQQTFEELTNYSIEHNPWSAKICSNLIRLLILKMAESSVTSEDYSGIAYDNYLRCVSILNQQHLKFRTLDDIAEACCIDASYLCRLFRKYGHQSPYQYFLRLNMNHAADLLSKRGLLIQEVAEMMGYTDPMHFSRTFKKVMGIAPSQFVKIGREKQENL